MHPLTRIALSCSAVAICGCASGRPDPGSTPPSSTVEGAPTAATHAFNAGGQNLESARFDRLLDRGPKAGGAIMPMGEGTAAVAAPATRPYALAKAPVEPTRRTELPDDRVRLVWQLQGVGAPGLSAGSSGGRRSVESKPVDTAPLAAMLVAEFGEAVSAIGLPGENKLFVTCDSNVEDDVVSLLRDVDRPGRQVEIRARIFEVNHGFDYQQGVRLLANRIAEDGTQTALSTFRTAELLESAAGQPFQGSIISVMQVLQDVGINLDVSFELLAETGLINVVSEPRLTVAEGDTGYLLAGQEIPIQSADFQKGVLNARTEYKPVGVQLYVTPQLVTGEHVRLHALSVVSSVAGFTPLPTLQTHGQSATSLLVNPIIDSREAETNVTVGHGDTLVISGLRMVRQTTREDKVPGLGDLPLIGHLFKNHRTQRRMTDLYFFLTPVVVDNGGMASAW